MLLGSGGLLHAAGDVEPEPDLVTMKKGRAREGRVVYEDNEHLILRVKSRDREILLEDVESVRANLRDLPLALDALATLDQRQVGALIAFARYLEKSNLPLEARLVYWKVLVLEPGNEIANVALGHRKRKKSYVIPHAGKWWRFDKLAEVCEDFGKAWEFETTHYRLRTNLPLAQALDTAFDLECIYRGFYGTLGSGLELCQVTETMAVSIHATSSSYPQIGQGRAGYYSTSETCVYMDASKGLSRATLIHEGTHQLLDFSARRMRPGKGKIPGWLDEGLAEYMTVTLRGAPGELTLVPGGRNESYLARHAGTKKPYGLKRVLNFQADDFMASSKVLLKYAQSYTLVAFCLDASEGAYRHGFFEFLRGAYAGKSSATHFKKAMGLKEKKLEEAWIRFARAGAG